MDPLTDGMPIAIVASLFAAVFLWSYMATGFRTRLFAALLMICGAGGALLADSLVKTDVEELQDFVLKVAREFQNRDPKIIEHFSMQCPLRDKVPFAMNIIGVRDDLALDNIEASTSNNRSRARIKFRVSATIEYALVGNVGKQIARFGLELGRESGEWRIREIRRFHPIRDEEIEVLSDAR